MVAAKPSTSESAASNRSSPALKSSPAPRATRQRTPGSRPVASSASAIAAIVSRPHALRWRWLSQLMIAGGAELFDGDVHRSPLWLSDRVGQCVAAGRAEDLRGLVLGHRQAARGELVHGHVGAQDGFEPLRVGGSFDVDVQRRHDRVAVGHDRVAGAAEQLADRLRVDVDRLHAQHVVAAAADADARGGSAAGAGRGPDGGEVARAVAQQRRGFPVQVGPHELARDAVGQRERLGGLGVDHLEQRVLAGGQVQAVALAALAGHRRPDVAHPERVGDGDVPARSRSRRARRRARRPARPR